MRKLNGKLRSQSGASILLALLFLLVCMMVGASVLMAAVSNAGKIQSNYEEQQRYLALSSALRLVSDQLERAQYRGRYQINEWTEIEEVTETNEKGETVSVEIEHKYYNVQQARGAFSCGSLAVLEEIKDPETGESMGERTKEGALLSFQKEMDGLFAGEFSGTGYYEGRLSGADIAPLPTGKPRVLTVRVLDEEEGKDQFSPVEVEIGMDANRRIHLKAVMNIGTETEPKNYVMEAELAPSGDMPTIRDYPVDRTPKKDINTALMRPGEKAVTTYKMTDPVGWELDWITREAKEAGG
nr:hypothetical protein [uncultured Oscillibacter sp.]